MIERENGNSLPTQKQIAEAMDRYKILLDHHKIAQDEQDTLWVDVYKKVEENPMQMVSEIQNYWETTFGTNGNRRVNSSSDTTGVSRVSNSNNGARLGAEAALNKWRRDWRNESFENTRAGGRIKARKKARKTNG